MGLLEAYWSTLLVDLLRELMQSPISVELKVEEVAVAVAVIPELLDFFPACGVTTLLILMTNARADVMKMKLSANQGHE